jgi:hypothetical protein
VAKTPCGFCESLTAKITNEHLFGEWMGPLFGVGRGKLKMQHTLDRERGELRTTWQAYRLDQQVRMACKPCNQGWMSAMESAVAPIITPMIQHDARRLITAQERTAIAVWAIKTAMVAEFINKPKWRYFRQAERTAFMRDSATIRDLGAYVWLGCYVDKNDGVHGLHAVGTLEDRVPAVHISAFAVGKFTIQVLVKRGLTDRMLPAPARSGPWAEALVLAWPAIEFGAGTRLPWPPRRGINAHGFDRIFERFIEAGSDRGLYGPGGVI